MSKPQDFDLSPRPFVSFFEGGIPRGELYVLCSSSKTGKTKFQASSEFKFHDVGPRGQTELEQNEKTVSSNAHSIFN